MTHELLRLYPAPHETVNARGLYLNLHLHRLGSPEQPFVYANFLSSLDGRIAVEDPIGGQAEVPRRLTTAVDFRLFLELEAQADCLITHGGYLRALAEGRLGNILQVGQRPEHQDLSIWRRANGLAPQPDVVVASASLDFPMPENLALHGQRCRIVTVDSADPVRLREWQQRGYEVLRAGPGPLVDGRRLVGMLGERGYRSLYLIAGPHMLDTMLRGKQLARLFQTITHQLLGGVGFRTVSPGPQFGSDGHLKLRSLYFDADGPESTGQWFSQFDVIANAR